MADNGYIVVTLKKAFEIKRFFKGLPCEGMTDGYVRYPRQFQGPGEFIGFAIPPGTQICDDPFAQSQEDAPVLLQKLQGFWKDNHGQSFTVRIKGKDAVCRQGEKIHDLLLKDNRVYFGRWMRYFLISVDNEAGKARWQLAAGKDPIGHLGVAFEWLEDTDRSAQRNRMMMLESRKLKAVHLSNMQAAATDPNIREFLQGIKATAPAVQLSEHTQTVPQAWAQTGA
eukprot:GEMP01065878.1.p1 GENE.GEMP01065878.1~~GEMP01065878.1.p1  ORF type:complete len:264 (+),score=43.12 GEMP01065878.1:116-793(+)